MMGRRANHNLAHTHHTQTHTPSHPPPPSTASPAPCAPLPPAPSTPPRSPASLPAPSLASASLPAPPPRAPFFGLVYRAQIRYTEWAEPERGAIRHPLDHPQPNIYTYTHKSMSKLPRPTYRQTPTCRQIIHCPDLLRHLLQLFSLAQCRLLVLRVLRRPQPPQPPELLEVHSCRSVVGVV